MHTILVIAGGLVMLGLFLFIAKTIGRGNRSSLATAALSFVPVWLAAALVNMWAGVSRAGYTLAAEAPILLLVVGAPAAVAWLLWSRLSKN